VRRLRAKLGAEHEALIGTVRNVGYRFVPIRPDDGGRGQPRGAVEVTPEDTAAPADADADGGRSRDKDRGHDLDMATGRLPGENRGSRPEPGNLPARGQVERRGSSPARADR
jgi:hypothetical protein